MKLDPFNLIKGNYLVSHICGLSNRFPNDVSAENFAMKHLENCQHKEPITIEKLSK